VFELFVLIAVGYALYRRLVTRVARLTVSAESVLILVLIALLMITDWLISGAPVAAGWMLAHPWSPAELVFGTALGGLSPGVNGWIYEISWWTHLGVLLLFLNLLPYGKHFHVLTSVFSVYLRRLDSLGRLPKLDFEDDEAEEFGVSRPEQLTWRNWLDTYSCTECGRCDYFCPAKQTGKSLSPRQIITGTRNVLYRQQPLYLRQMAGGGNEEAATEERAAEYKFVGDVHTDEQLWDCTTCGACDTHCPLFIEHVEPIIEMRRHLVLEEEGRFPDELVQTFKGLETQGNPWSIGAHQRLDWAEGLELPTVEEEPDAEYIYFVGCLASLDDRNKETARLRKAVEYGESIGLEVYAGHGLTYANIGPIVAIPQVSEVNIGHSIISRAVFTGLERAVREMKMLLKRA